MGQLDQGPDREVRMATQLVDHSALKVNQTGIITTVLVAFIGSAFYRPRLVLIPLLATVLLITVPVLGLALALLVAVLAFVNLAFGYCVGCQIYFQLSKAGVIRAS